FKRMKRAMPWWMNLTPLAPAFLIKWGMKQVAKTKDYGTLDWLSRDDCEEKIEAYFGSREEQSGIGGWKEFELRRPSENPLRLSHGYDETKPETELCIDDMREAARFRGGECLSDKMAKGDLDTPLKWRCAFGHEFEATPRLVLKGGHWCKDCLPAPWRYAEEARVNPFLAQVWK
ncbi:MAG: NAD(P)-dependent oxidoreductase, partial [Muribaculaceae bacterium]|nr:NAD(P)-dependent oxidoreductase [Muribaculaceae bacterium]